MKHFINLKDIPAKDLRKIITDAKKRKKQRKKLNNLDPDKAVPLKGKLLIQMFEKSSLRTRLSFFLAISQLGGRTLTLRRDELHLSEGDESIEMSAMQGDYGFVSAIIYLAFTVLGIVVLSTVVFSLMNLFSNKDKLKKAGISIGSFLAVIIVAFILSEGVETPMQDGKVLSAAGSRWVETGIRTFYLLTLIAVGIMIFNSVRKLIKK